MHDVEFRIHNIYLRGMDIEDFRFDFIRKTPLLLCTACCLDFNFLYDFFNVYAAFFWASFSCEVLKRYNIQQLELQVEFHTLASILQ